MSTTLRSRPSLLALVVTASVVTATTTLVPLDGSGPGNVPQALAAPPTMSLDTTWSDDGRSAIDTGPGRADCDLTSTRSFADGSMIGVSVCPWRAEAVVVSRYTAAGAFDPGYGGELAPGHRAFPQQTLDGHTFAGAAIGADGSAALVWRDEIDANRHERIVRLDPNGDLLTSFGTGGTADVVWTGMASHDVGPRRLDASGRLMTVFASGTDTRFGRVGTDGVLDTTFGSGGVVTRPPDSRRNMQYWLDPDGTIVWIRSDDDTDPSVVDVHAERIAPSGALDTTFGEGDGVVALGTVLPDDAGNVGVTRTVTGHVVALMPAPDGSGAVVRLTPDGAYDTTFDSDGVLVLDPGSLPPGTSAPPLVDPVDASLVAWSVDGSGGLALLRIAADGSSLTGTALDLVALDGPIPMIVAGIDAGRRLVVSASDIDWATMTSQHQAFRLDASFALDTDYGTGGFADVAWLFTSDAMLPDGTLRVAHRQITQLDVDGDPDSTWGGDGSIDHRLPQGMFDEPSDLAVDGAGRTVVAIESFTEQTAWRSISVARLDAAGDPDVTFGGGDGLVTIDAEHPDGSTVIGGPLLRLGGIDADGRVYVVVHVQIDDGAQIRWVSQLVRLTAAGVVDTTYPRPLLTDVSVIDVDADGGVLLREGSTLVRRLPDGSPDTSFTAPTDVQWVDLQVAPDGRIRGCDTASCRSWNADGTADTSFGGDGVVEVPRPPGAPGGHVMWIWSESYTADGGLVLLVEQSDDQGDVAASRLVRLLPDGSVDPWFGIDGWVTLPAPPAAPSGATEWYAATVVQSGIVAITQGDGSVDPSATYQVARFDARGTLDTGFGTGGFVSIPDSPGFNRHQLVAHGAQALVWNTDRLHLLSATGELTSVATDLGEWISPWSSLATTPDAVLVTGSQLLEGDGYATGSFDTEVVRYLVDDRSALDSLQVAADDDASNAVSGSSIALDVRSNDAATVGTLLTPDVLHVAHGVASTQGNGAIGYLAPTGWSGTDVVTYRVCSATDSMRCDVARWTIVVSSPPTTTTTTTTTTSPAPTTSTAPGVPPADGSTAIEPIDPDRLFDTRPGEPQGAVAVAKQKFGGDDVLRVRVAGVSGIPSTGVAAVSLNVTAVDGDSAGYLTLYPCGERPTVSSLNFTPSAVIANAVIVPVSPAGDVCLASNTRTHVVADVNGWFRTGSGFTAVAPTRLADTRVGEADGALTVTKQRYSGATVLRMRVAGTGGVPTHGVGAVSLNVTAVDPAAAGFLTVFPCGSLPLVSSVNFVARQVVANAVIAPVSPTGEVCVFSNTPTDVVVDLNGWFATGAGFTAVEPTRLFDTRPTEPQGAITVQQAPIGPTRTLRVRVTGAAGVPASGVGAVSLNVTVVGPAGAGFVTVHPCGAVPPTSNVNFAAGQVVPNAVVAPVSTDGEICLVSNVSTHVLADVNGWFLAGAAG